MSKPKLIRIPNFKESRPYRRTRLSEVSASIEKEFGHIIGRSQRKKIAKNTKKPFIIFTTSGKPDYRLPYQVGRQLQKAEAYKAKITSKKWRKAAGDR